MNKENKKKLSEGLRDNLPKLLIGLLSVLYITQGLFTIIVKDVDILALIGAAAFSILVGFTMALCLNAQGIRDGRNSQEFRDSMSAYGAAKADATPYFDRLGPWCDYKNAFDLESKKRDIIQSAGLRWKLYKIGYYDSHIPEDEDKKKALMDAKTCKIQPLKQSELLSDIPHEKNAKHRHKFGKTVGEYMTSASIQDIITRPLVGIVSGMFMLSPIFSKDNYKEILAQMLWNAMQITMWLTLGVLKYINSKSFMIDEYRQTHIIQKTELLKEFTVTVKNNPGIIDMYDEDADIDLYIKELADERKKAKSDTGEVPGIPGAEKAKDSV